MREELGERRYNPEDFYRTIEGGADVERVYNFAWLHFAVASLRLRF